LLAAELQRLKPRAVLMLGLAGKSRFIRIERFARLDASPTAPDAGGRVPAKIGSSTLPIASTAAVEPALAAMQRAGLRARMSASAGRYLCNASYARALQQLPRDVPVLFIHIPWPRGWCGSYPSNAAPDWRPALPALAMALADSAEAALLRPARLRAVP
ncbi:MAG: hypothetical protein ACRCWO_11725, partial [Bosea sp. (in: a-proteobacteria)]